MKAVDVAINAALEATLGAEASSVRVGTRAIPVPASLQVSLGYTTRWSYRTLSGPMRGERGRSVDSIDEAKARISEDSKALFQRKLSKMHKDPAAWASDFETVRAFDTGQSYGATCTCVRCGGETVQRCERCDGHARLTCGNCSGRRVENCVTCRGGGKVRNRDGLEVSCGDCRGGRTMRCSRCQGAGQVDCRACRNGLVDCEGCLATGVQSQVFSGECAVRGQAKIILGTCPIPLLSTAFESFRRVALRAISLDGPSDGSGQTANFTGSIVFGLSMARYQATESLLAFVDGRPDCCVIDRPLTGAFDGFAGDVAKASREGLADFVQWARRRSYALALFCDAAAKSETPAIVSIGDGANANAPSGAVRRIADLLMPSEVKADARAHIDAMSKAFRHKIERSEATAAYGWFASASFGLAAVAIAWALLLAQADWRWAVPLSSTDGIARLALAGVSAVWALLETRRLKARMSDLHQREASLVLRPQTQRSAQAAYAGQGRIRWAISMAPAVAAVLCAVALPGQIERLRDAPAPESVVAQSSPEALRSVVQTRETVQPDLTPVATAPTPVETDGPTSTPPLDPCRKHDAGASGENADNFDRDMSAMSLALENCSSLPSDVASAPIAPIPTQVATAPPADW